MKAKWPGWLVLGSVIPLIIIALCAGRPVRPVRVLVAGDSISLGYTPFLAEFLGRGYAVRHIPDNGKSAINVLAHAYEWILSQPADIILLNAGIHDSLRVDGAARPSTPAQYRDRVGELMTLCRAHTRARILWVSTTPVDDLRSGGAISNRDIEIRNAIASEAAVRHGVETIDLYARMRGHLGLLSADSSDPYSYVHWRDAGYRVMAAAIADAIQAPAK